MSPTPCTRSPDPATGGARPRPGVAWVIAAALLLTLAGCAQLASTSQRISKQVAEAPCVGRCRETKDRCDDNARFEYQQCQAGYNTAQRDYRRCNTADWDPCGYPWWSCSQNLYGYCTNRYRECRLACRSPRG
ncbi:hypothetical protein [uncultured Thiodictyon sp.]|uniref:hypothetical protein n=1 Tax=uncultured Thiodictyon sp. TaxID=1846217 RepID=UPI0025E5C6A8|nr:hypothetical protein [uncultured Thiodictyon sp.]